MHLYVNLNSHYVNSQGCGYPPVVDCAAFVAKYGNVSESVVFDYDGFIADDFDDNFGDASQNKSLLEQLNWEDTFTCYYSRANPKMAIIDLDLNSVYQDLFYSIAIPLPCLLISIVYMFVAYFYIYTDPQEVSRGESSLTGIWRIFGPK